MTDEERQQVDAALNIVNQAVQNWHPRELDSMTMGQQWQQMLSAWAIVSGIVRQTLQAPPQTNGSGPHIVEEAATDG